MRAILTYHSIDDSGSPISVPADVFAEHVQWLTNGGPRVLPLDELLARDTSDPGDAVALTFDDGFANFADAADRLLAEGLPVTLFVVTGRVGRTNAWQDQPQRGIPTLPLLDWPALEALVQRGVSIGAHTRTHPRLTALSDTEIEDELDGCANELEQRLGARPKHLAYPYGAVDARVATLAGRRFSSSLTTRFAAVPDAVSRTEVPRLDMFYFRQPDALARWGTKSFSRRLWSIGVRRRIREALWE